MKKFLLTLIVTMLTCIGAWAQETILIDGGSEGITSASNFKLNPADVPSDIQAGDFLKLFYENLAGPYDHYFVGVACEDAAPLFFIDKNNPGTSKDEHELTQTDIDKIKQNGIYAAYNTITNIKVLKLSLFRFAAATGITLDATATPGGTYPYATSVGIGTTTTLAATVAPATASQKVNWSVVEGDAYASVNENGVVTGNAAGTAVVRATVASNSELYVDCAVTVKQGYNLSLSADKTTVLNTVPGTITLTPTVGLEGMAPVEGTDYDIDYTIKDNADPTKVTISGNVVTIAEGATAGTYTVVATLNPKDDTYAGATATKEFVVDAPFTDALTIGIGNQTFGKSDGTQAIAGGLKVEGNATFGDNNGNYTFVATAESDASGVVTAVWNDGANQHNNSVEFNVVGVGEANVTLTVQATNAAGKIAIATKTIKVTVSGDPLKFTMGELTINDDQALTLDAVKAAITKVYTGYDQNPTIVTSGYTVEMKYNDAVVTSVPAQGSDVNSFEITVNVKATNTDYTDATPATKTVTVTHLKSFTLGLTADKTSILDNGQQATITPAATFGEDPVDISSYSVSPESNEVADIVKNTDNTITVTGKNPGTVTITVTATPSDQSTYATVSNTITITVTEGPRVTLTKQTIDGKEYVVVNVPEGGAFGGISDTPKYTSTDGTTLEELKVAANVKVTGYLANSDAAELIHLIGDNNTLGDNPQGYCYTLDMGAAQMTEAVETAFVPADSKNVEHSWVTDIYQHGLWLLNELTLPQPATGSTVIPTGMYKLYDPSTTNLKKLVIPNGWTIVSDHAFADYSGNGLKGLSDLKLPDSVEKIGEAAFQNLGVKTLYLPYNLKSIAKWAFDVTGNAGTVNGNKISPMQDVYFTGPAPLYVDKEAFATCSQMCNNTVDDQKMDGKNMPTATRLDYSVASNLACLMHYPKEYEADYIDGTRVYEVLDTRETPYSKGTTLYVPEGWDGLKNKVETSPYRTQGGTAVWMENGGKIAGGFPDVTYGNAMIWPSQYQMTTGYLIANAGYRWDGTELDPDTQFNPAATPDNGLIDRRGLYQFIVAVGNAQKQEEWPFKYEQDLWYTISLPFDMSVEEIKTVFGAKTQVCRFSKVVRDINEETGDKILRLEFRNSVMEEPDSRPKDIVYYSDESGAPTADPVEKSGIRHHYPYMIKPSGAVNYDDAKVKFDSETGKRYYIGYKSVPGSMVDETQKAVDLNDGELSGQWFYYFRANLMQTTIKKNSYVLANYNGKHQFVFYKGKKVKDEYGNYVMENGNYVYEDGSTANANTAYVQLNLGEAELTDFFTIAPVTGNSDVKLGSFFGDADIDGTATDIDKIEIICGNDKVESNKIYTINGQLVNGKSLAPGLYIKNGKKYVVK